MVSMQNFSRPLILLPWCWNLPLKFIMANFGAVFDLLGPNGSSYKLHGVKSYHTSTSSPSLESWACFLLGAECQPPPPTITFSDAPQIFVTVHLGTYQMTTWVSGPELALYNTPIWRIRYHQFYWFCSNFCHSLFRYILDDHLSFRPWACSV